MTVRAGFLVILSCAFLAACGGGGSSFTPLGGGTDARALAQHVAPDRTPHIVEYALPAQSDPAFISADSRGDMWYTLAGPFPSYAFNQIGRLTPGGKMTSYPVSTAGSGLCNIIQGADGAMWFAEAQAGKIGRITLAGVVTNQFELRKNSSPVFMTLGPDKAVWIAGQGQAKHGAIFRMAMNGSSTEYALKGSGYPVGIVTGPDGAIWFTLSTGAIGRMTTKGVVTKYPIPSQSSTPLGLVVGPDKNLWFTESGSNKIGRITTGGTIVEYPVPTAKSGPNMITTGPDGALWFTEFNANNVARITTEGAVTEYAIPTKKSQPLGIAAARGAIWFTEIATNKIGTLKIPR